MKTIDERGRSIGEMNVPTTDLRRSQTIVSAQTTCGIEVIEVTSYRYRARIALQGATLLDWHPRDTNGQEGENVVDGYRDVHELTSQNGVRNGILAPFTNRLVRGRFDFDGRTYRLLPIAEGENEVYHGFLRVRQFELRGTAFAGENVRLEFVHKTVSAKAPSYSYDLEVSVAYVFSVSGVELEIATTNSGGETVPYVAGWHPYFRLPGSSAIDDLTLQVPSTFVVDTIDLIPQVTSDGEIKLQNSPTFHRPTRIGDHVLDCCFTQLIQDEDGISRTILTDPTSGTELSVWQERGHMHVYTGDTLARDRRRSIALEPVEDLTNAFNLPSRIKQVRLEPGDTRTFKCGFEYERGERRETEKGSLAGS
ncbi:aldose 1-epimerase [Agrobacterium larrymoorei]|nr:aldose 1-epimerase [Agrobacterium larrymoorei]